MNTFDAIAERRSIRKFKDEPIADAALEKILMAGILAPSGKNRQPWQFYVVKQDQRAEMINVLMQGLENTKAAGHQVGSAEYSFRVMEKAAASVFIYNPEGSPPWAHHAIDDIFQMTVDVQSVGAAIQNMLLEAHELGIGSLWICDVFAAYQDVTTWLGAKGALIAAVSFGIADQTPDARPRKALAEVVQYK